MNKKTVIILVSAAFVVLGISTVATYACLKHLSGTHPQADTLSEATTHNWAQQIGLSAEQKEKLKPYEISLNKDLDAIQLKLAEERIGLCRLIQDEPAESKKVDEYVQRVAALEAEQQKRVVKHIFVLRDVLRPDQREKLFASLMSAICDGCKSMTPDDKSACLCGMHGQKS